MTTSFPVLDSIAIHQHEMIRLRRHLHAHPELSLEEFATSDLVAERLADWGYEVHRGIGETGLVGVLRRGPGRAIGLRADMDALPMQEISQRPHASTVPGKMHGCGHDGHTASLLAAARHLAEEGDFKGTLNLIFQPAEEARGGAQRMVDDGLFERFPCDAIFAFHNMPGVATGKLGFRPGHFMASSDTLIIRLHGRGGHGAMPHHTVDTAVVAAYIVTSLQTLVSRNTGPLETGVVTVGMMRAGSASNVIAEHAELQLSVRAMSDELRQKLLLRIRELVMAQAESFGARAEIETIDPYPPLYNDTDCTEFARQVALEWAGPEALVPVEPVTGSEDFAVMLQHCPGCYFLIGNGDGDGGCMVHNPGYDFNDDALPVAASYWVKLVEAYLA